MKDAWKYFVLVLGYVLIALFLYVLIFGGKIRIEL